MTTDYRDVCEIVMQFGVMVKLVTEFRPKWQFLNVGAQRLCQEIDSQIGNVGGLNDQKRHQHLKRVTNISSATQSSTVYL